MRAIDIAREAFAGLTPANPANPANGRASACFPGLRIVANVCESTPGETLVGGEIRKDSQAFASPETRASACDSQNSQLSQGVGAVSHSQGVRDAVLARLVRWGWPRDVAEATAARIARRDADDDRRTCPECRHYVPGRCRNHRRAGLRHPDVGRDLAALAQRCPGHEPREAAE